jgi:hypothetical protein
VVEHASAEEVMCPMFAIFHTEKTIGKRKIQIGPSTSGGHSSKPRSERYEKLIFVVAYQLEKAPPKAPNMLAGSNLVRVGKKRVALGVVSVSLVNAFCKLITCGIAYIGNCENA